MHFRKIGAVLSFFVAFAIGAAFASLAATRTEIAAVPGPDEIPVTAPERSTLKTRTPLGKWPGRWNHDLADCTVEIDRVDGNNFYGTLTKNGAEIAISGMLDPKTDKVTIHEKKVLALGHCRTLSLAKLPE